MSTPDELRRNREIDATIAERVRATDFGEILASEGQTVVALDDDGRLVRYSPEGTAVPQE